MRQKRAKSYRKQMLVYNHTFKFREPYQVLVDDQMVLDCHNSSFDLLKGLKRTLQAEVKVMITQCCMQALYETRNQDAIEVAKQFERRRCNHPPKDPLAPIECLNDVVNVGGVNKHRYVIASQNIDIRRGMRKIPGVPLIHLSRSVMIMEPLSEASSKLSQDFENEKLVKGLNDPSIGRPGVSTADNSRFAPEVSKAKRKGPRGPNPLSIKKKKTSKGDAGKDVILENKGDTDTNGSSDDHAKKRRRRRHKGGPKNDENTTPDFDTGRSTRDIVS